MAKKRANQDSMSGAELQRIRREVFNMSQPKFAEFLGLNFRTVVRLESRNVIPLYHARHVRCLMKQKEQSE